MVWAGRLRCFCFPKGPYRLWDATQRPMQWVPRFLFPGLKLTTNIHLVPRLKMSGVVPPGPQMSWRPVQGPDIYTRCSVRVLF